MEPKVILVNGFPASGKSTLAQRLSKDLKIPLLGKDHLKEFLADTMEVRGEEWSAILGRAANAMLIALLDAAAGKRALVLESAFIAGFARQDIERILELNHTQAIEVYCTVHREERLRRWQTRLQNGQRHPIHTDGESHVGIAEAQLQDKYAPLRVGEYIEVDTAHFGEKDYGDLLLRLKKYMEDSNGESD